MTSLAAPTSVGFDPTRDKTYRRAKLGRDVVDWLAWLELGGAASRTPRRRHVVAGIYVHTNVEDVARHMALIEAGEV